MKIRADRPDPSTPHLPQLQHKPGRRPLTLNRASAFGHLRLAPVPPMNRTSSPPFEALGGKLPLAAGFPDRKPVKIKGVKAKPA